VENTDGVRIVTMTALKIPNPNQNNPASIPKGTPLPWGRWGLRAVALSYLTVLLIVPLGVIMQDGFSAGLGEFWHQITLRSLAVLWG
jgi:ABC-type sulfate transport system permease subunit